jgi:hypothetical protein
MRLRKYAVGIVASTVRPDRGAKMMKPKIIVLTLLLTPLVGLSAAQAAGAAPSPVPDVIAPGDLPTLQPIAPDATQAVVAQGSYSAAPMPDADAAAPVSAPDEQTQLNPAIYSQQSGYLGDGYAAGSSDHARTLQPATGVKLNVPL